MCQVHQSKCLTGHPEASDVHTRFPVDPVIEPTAQDTPVCHIPEKVSDTPGIVHHLLASGVFGHYLGSDEFHHCWHDCISQCFQLGYSLGDSSVNPRHRCTSENVSAGELCNQVSG